MFIAIEHEIHDPEAFQDCAQRAFPIPEDLRLHQFLPATDLTRAACLYEGPSVARVREHVDNVLGETSTQRYYAVAADGAIGLPAR